MYDQFFAFARERHSIYLRRQAGQPAPWTKNPILHQYRFTNVFRELDATTVWFRENVREPMRDRPEVLLATVLFRWFNRTTTGEAIFRQTQLQLGTSPGWGADAETPWQALEARGVSELPAIADALQSYCGKGPYVTGAYIIKTPNGMDKLSGVLWCVEQFMTQRHSIPGDRGGFLGNPQPLEYCCEGFAQACLTGMHTGSPVSLEEAWGWLRQFPYLGDFMAYEIVTDLRHTDLLCDAPDIMTWANPGPGAKRGMQRILYGEPSGQLSRAQQIDMMQNILDESRREINWPQRPGLAEEPGWGWPEWEMRDVEHTLCEFDKYERARLGQGRPRGVYRHG